MVAPARGLAGCIFSIGSNPYDHERQVQQPSLKSQLDKWDCVLLRSDDTVMRVHPELRSLVVPLLLDVAGQANQSRPRAAASTSPSEVRSFAQYKNIGPRGVSSSHRVTSRYDQLPQSRLALGSGPCSTRGAQSFPVCLTRPLQG